MPKERVPHAFDHKVVTANDITKGNSIDIYKKPYRRHNFKLWHYNKLASFSEYLYMLKF